MLNITYYPNREKKSSNDLYFETDFSFSYEAVVAQSGGNIEIRENGILVGTVNGTQIQIKDKIIKQKRLGIFGWAWLISESPEVLLHPKNDEYYINESVVAKVTMLAALTSNSLSTFSSLFSGVTPNSEVHIKLNFNEKEIFPLLAFSLLLVDVSRSRHGI